MKIIWFKRPWDDYKECSNYLDLSNSITARRQASYPMYIKACQNMMPIENNLTQMVLG